MEFGGPGHKNQPCVQRWCRAKAAQRRADLTDRGRGAIVGGRGGGGTKRPLESRSVGRSVCRSVDRSVFENSMLYALYYIFFGLVVLSIVLGVSLRRPSLGCCVEVCTVIGVLRT